MAEKCPKCGAAQTANDAVLTFECGTHYHLGHLIVADGCWSNRLRTKDRTITALKAERDRLWELVQCKDELLACYRLGRRPSGGLLDRIGDLKAALAETEGK